MAVGVEKYFKQALKKIVFINLSDNFVNKHESLKYLKGIPVPVSIDVIEAEAKNTQYKGSFSPAAAAQAMVNVIGADSNFPYAEQYKQFLQHNMTSVYLTIMTSGVDFASAGRFIEAAILFRAADLYDRWERSNAPTRGIPTIRNPKLPDSPDALYNYARACRDIFMDEAEEDLGKKSVFREESVRAFEQLMKEFPDYDQSYYFLGFFYMNKKRYEDAKRVWLKFITISDDQAMLEDVRSRMGQVTDLIIYEKGYLEVVNSRCQEGLDILLPLYEKYKEWWNLMFFIGLAYRKLGEFEKALFFFKEVVRLKPSQNDAYNELGLCYASLGDNENAEKFFKKATLLDNDDPELLCNLAAVYMNMGRLDEAELTLARAEKLAPGEEITVMWRNELEKLKK